MSRALRLTTGGLFALLLVLIPIVTGTIGSTFGHSLRYNLNWQYAFERAISAGTLLPRHLPDLWMGAGGLDFFFYGPLPFYTNSLLVRPFCPGCSVGTVIAIGCGLAISASALTFFRFARLFVDRVPAFVGATFYAILLPYHVVIDWAARQSVGEVFAYAFVPMMAYGIESIFRNEDRDGWLIWGLAGTIMSHLPSALLAVHILGGISVLRILFDGTEPREKLRFALRLVRPVVIGGALAALYWLPALVLLRDVSPRELYGDYFHAPNWLYGVSFDQPNPRWAKVILVAILTPVAIVGGNVLFRYKTMRRAEGLFWIVGPAALSWVLTLDIAYPIWRYWIVKKVQFPWRMTQFIDLSAAVAVAVAIARGSKSGRLVMLVASTLVAVAGSTWILDHESEKLSRATPDSHTESVFGPLEYLPEAPFRARFRKEVTEQTGIHKLIFAQRVLAAKEGVASMSLQPRVLYAKVVDGSRQIRLPVFYWKHWRAEDSQGKPLVVEVVSETGTMLVRREDGAELSGMIFLTLPYHWSEWAGFFLSLCALLAFLMTSRPWRARS